MENKKGMVTIPSDKNFVEGTKRIGALWGADAIRDCDGTDLPTNAHELAKKVYKTYFVVRGDNAWADKHKDESIRAFLSSERVTSFKGSLEIEVAKGYLKDEVEPDWDNL
ncbi:MAG TPA: 1,3-beta-galactosyl-N-acetylhexosamine phosphorylase, partial [Firmicutes bacterium]|nr:1,3-beta-galactosyl-N-acetylhexosamine phosphorylase [Bacillota bacterium]